MAALRRPLHKQAHPDCQYGATTWGECDKVGDNIYADWQAMQQVLLAYRIVVIGDPKWFRKDEGQFGQLVHVLEGTASDFINDDGNASQAPWVIRLRAAIERVKAGDLPEYNLYAVPGHQPITEGG